ncbi:hypothetical protein ACFSC6_18130 [Rufibacter sediminis]|uniref:Glycosyltransferase RgtA/B/C/D-like domain-containing protein n=1 Tax=Rufibacter sediminis TaxID=2762756 RepID=A0ABR6VQH9_9BACT|nr:hypothetical protein [Rufibacter sediminis]MBC3539443.1 hypothetical protein [Rufibacter sediminis]
MIRFFRSLFPSRWVVLVLLFLLIRLPLLIFGLPSTLSELHYVLLGERLHQGFTLYQDLYDTTGPLSGLVYWLLDAVAPRSYLAHRLLATFLLGYQAFLLNFVFNRNQVHPFKSYVPALLYMLFGSIFFELDVLSPLLLGHTFVVLAVYSLTAISKEASNAGRLFKAGFMLGLAALCYLPMVWFLVLGFFAIIYFASGAFRSTLLMLTGFVFPFTVVLTYFLYQNALGPFLEQALTWSWQLSFDLGLPVGQVLTVAALPLGLLVLSLLSLPLVNLGANYQARFMQFMLIWTIVVALVLISGHDGSVKGLILLLPLLAYFGIFLFSWWGNRLWIAELLFLVLVAGVMAMRYNPLGLVYPALGLQPELIQVRDDPKYRQVEGQSMLVLGPDLNYYQHNSLGSPYLRWDLAKPYFGRLHYYESLFTILQDLRKAPPAYIVDQQNLMPELQYKLPLIFQRYEKVENGPYYRRVR